MDEGGGGSTATEGKLEVSGRAFTRSQRSLAIKLEHAL